MWFQRCVWWQTDTRTQTHRQTHSNTLLLYQDYSGVMSTNREVSATEALMLLVHECGTVCHRPCDRTLAMNNLSSYWIHFCIEASWARWIFRLVESNAGWPLLKWHKFADISLTSCGSYRGKLVTENAFTSYNGFTANYNNGSAYLWVVYVSMTELHCG